LDNLTPPVHAGDGKWPAWLPKEADRVRGDVRNADDWRKALRGVDVVFHLAALIGIPFSYHSPDSYVDTNVKGTLNVLQAAREEGVKKVVHTSTSEVYGTAQFTPIPETHPLNPQSPYAATKAAADHLVQSFYLSFGLPVATMRPFNTYGPRQSARAVIPTIIAQLCAGKRAIHLGNTHATRDFNYVSDTVDAFIKVAESEKTVGQVLNTGSGREISIDDLVKLIAGILKIKVKIVTQKGRLRPALSEVERLLCDASRLRELCGWSPRVSLEEGLRQTYRWIKANPKYFKSEIYNV
ncbi:MAG: GDP-mannose 4,6-dehydratase, partial [Candidatus Omnitrophica bacterium]|nr:GDP-mannose 4,6-dehydratase [Candidatus Omnitrophota bacterium]